MDYHIVVSYNNQDITWTNTVKNLTSHKNENEFETFLEYIIENYETLPSYLVLLKGNPFNKTITPENINQQIEGLLSRFGGVQVCDAVPFFNKPTIEGHYPTPEIRAPNYYYQIFKGNIPESFEYNSQNQYILSRDSIRNRPVGFYNEVLLMLKNDVPVMSRLFPYLFDMNVI